MNYNRKVTYNGTEYEINLIQNGTRIDEKVILVNRTRCNYAISDKLANDIVLLKKELIKAITSYEKENALKESKQEQYDNWDGNLNEK